MSPQSIFSIANAEEFERIALYLFRQQMADCEPYSRFVHALGVVESEVDSVEKIPFLPISFFKTDKIIAGNQPSQIAFTSSGTTGANTSTHYLADVALYEQSLQKGFEQFYGNLAQYCILALLPHYLERTGSSLVYMVQQWMAAGKHPCNGFFLHNTDALLQTLQTLQTQQQPTILIGVSFALLDFVQKNSLHFPQLIVMETGGMKGKHKEIARAQLHQTLCKSFGVPTIHSEYGMTELLSQAYSAGNGVFLTPPWMRIVIRDPYNPLRLQTAGKSGGINVIDLANWHSCAFIATQDRGKCLPNGGFEVLGRLANTPLRGCNMLIED
ncbi:acyltransferase [Bacteroidia bacterium]|nr:acyltransferase [Bacteroidia bacterium]